MKAPALAATNLTAADLAGKALDTALDVTVDDAAIFSDAQAWARTRNVAEARLVEAAVEMDSRGLARKHGRRPRELMIAVGLTPGVATQIVRLSDRMPTLDRIYTDLREGRMGAEMADVIGKGIALIERRVGNLTETDRFDCESKLLAQSRSAAAPRDVADTARGLANRLSAESDEGVDPATDRSSNDMTIVRTDDGRVCLSADIDVTTGSVIAAAIETLAKPRPEPDGSPDTRTAGQRRVDALLQIASLTGNTVSKPHVSVTVSAEAPEVPTIPWLGVVPTLTAQVLACDSKVEALVVDENGVPLAMGRSERTFPPAMKRALAVRDNGCIKCGAPAGWSHAHHIVYWSSGGATEISNGCLL